MRNGKNGNGLAGKFEIDAIRFYKNGVSTIKKVSIKEGLFEDAKLIHEASAILYKAVLTAIDAEALKRGISQDDLPDNVNKIRIFLRRRSALNGKVIKAFNGLYIELHLIGYYGKRGEALDPKIIEKGIENARFIIEKLTSKRIG